MTKLIEIKDLTYKYPTSDEDNLIDINMTIEKGKFYAIVGVNGGGKTTLCNVLRGFIPHFHKGDFKGEVYIAGKNLLEWDISELAEKIGFVFQNPFTQISGIKETVFGEIAFGLENLGVEVEEIKSRVQSMIDLLKINDLQDKNPIELSGGQKQRVALAAVMVMEPEIVIFDEPTSQLDPKGTEEIFEAIDILKRKGKTIILVEHKMELIAEYADYIVVMQDGTIKTSGSTEEIMSNIANREYGMELTQYTLLDEEMKRNNLFTKGIPITEKESIAVMKEWLGQ